MSDCHNPYASDEATELPLTPGRELIGGRPWNVWVDGDVIYINDKRHDLDTRGDTSVISFGLDRLVGKDLVAGLQASLTRTTSDGFDGDLQTDSTSYSIGPYFSYGLSPQWLIYGSLGFGQLSIDNQILNLAGTSESNQYSLNLQAEGQYQLGSALARPKIQLSQTRTSGDAYQLHGTILNRPVTLDMRNDSSDYGVIQTSLEINRTYDLGYNRLVMPYMEAGVSYEYARAESGQYLTGNLTYAEASPWAGMLRAGARSLFGKSTMADLAVAYQSLGVNDLSIWEIRLLVSQSF